MIRAILITAACIGMLPAAATADPHSTDPYPAYTPPRASPAPDFDTGDCDVTNGEGYRPASLPKTGGGLPNYDVPAYGYNPYLAAWCALQSSGSITLHYGQGAASPQHIDFWIVSFGQRAGSSVPIFSSQRDVNRLGPGDWRQSYELAVRPKNADVYAFVRVKFCAKTFLAHSDCAGWSPTLTVHLRNYELTAR